MIWRTNVWTFDLWFQLVCDISVNEQQIELMILFDWVFGISIDFPNCLCYTTHFLWVWNEILNAATHAKIMHMFLESGKNMLILIQ